MFYACSPCHFAIHIDCVSPSPATIEHETHPHPFNLILRQVPFTCDACGTAGSHAGYTCCTCNIQVHEKCISLPRFIKSKWHDHRLSHKHFLHREYLTTSDLDCIICHNEVDTDYGSYSCKFCNDVIFHAKCVLEDKNSYEEVPDDEEHLDASLNSFTVIEKNDDGEATLIEHCKHIGHHLMLSDKVCDYNDDSCDGCLLPISASFYHCSASECDFILHKVCAEFPKEKQIWLHDCRTPLVLVSNAGFECVSCEYAISAFGYSCGECLICICIRCIIALTPGARTHPGHEHRLFYYHYNLQEYRNCNACDVYPTGGFRCKDGDFCLDRKCFSLPITARHKYDEHRLSLTYHDDNSYSESHYCDICEDGREPNLWFYHCTTCDTSAHVDCVIDREHSFIKIGSSIDMGKFHPHPLTVVKKMYYYQDCSLCGEPCVDLSAECGESRCNYIIHFRCLLKFFGSVREIKFMVPTL